MLHGNFELKFYTSSFKYWDHSQPTQICYSNSLSHSQCNSTHTQHFMCMLQSLALASGWWFGFDGLLRRRTAGKQICNHLCRVWKTWSVIEDVHLILHLLERKCFESMKKYSSIHQMTQKNPPPPTPQTDLPFQWC